MIDGISETQVADTGFYNNDLNKSSESGKIPLWKEGITKKGFEKEIEIMIPVWNKKEMMQKSFEKERQKFQIIYNSKGKLREKEDSGRHLDFIA
jgi:hypothetical protein